MFKRLYEWTMSLANHPYAERWLGFIAFIESSIFPIPPDVMLIPMGLAERKKAFRFAAICTIGSVLGAILGYAIGFFLWQSVGEPIFSFYGYMDEFQTFQDGFEKWGAWLVFVFGITFFPFKVITIASGVFALNPLTFILACVLSRTPRFFIESTLLWYFGDPIRQFIEKRMNLVVTVVTLLVVLGFVAISFL